MGFQFETIDNPNLKVIKENQELKDKVKELEDKVARNSKQSSQKKK